MATLTRWEPLRKMSSFRREMRDLMRSYFGRDDSPEARSPLEGFMPAMDVSETPDTFVVKMEVPGLEAKDVDVKLEGDVLDIRGEKKTEKEDKGRDYFQVERTFGAFHRSVTLPSKVKADGIKAVCHHGVLEVTLPKTEEAKKRAIQVEVKN